MITTTQHKKNVFSKAKALFVTALMAVPALGNAQTVRINIANAQFTRPLIEKLVSEYQKQNPSFNAEIVTTPQAGDATVSITSDNSQTAGTIAHYVLLPIANSGNSILAEKKVQKGLNEKLTREIFVEKNLDDYIDSKDKKQLPGTVYSLSGSHSTTTELLANTLNVDVKDIKGKKVIGREENVISVVKKRPDAIAFDVASLVYDNTTHKPVSGVSVLPVDLDGNGKVTDDERAALTNLDALTDYIAKESKTSLPTGSVQISSQNKDTDAFVVWATTVGQDYVASQGYLKNNNQNIAQK